MPDIIGTSEAPIQVTANAGRTRRHQLWTYGAGTCPRCNEFGLAATGSARPERTKCTPRFRVPSRSGHACNARSQRPVGVGVEHDAGIKGAADRPGFDLGELEALYRAERRTVVGLAVLLTGDTEVGEELAQEAFVRIAPHLAGMERPGAYLRTIVINLCRDHGRRSRVADRQPVHRAPSAPPPPLPNDVTAEWAALCALPDRQRHVLVLRFWLDLAPGEIARLLGIPGSTVRSAIRRGLASLKEVLVDER